MDRRVTKALRALLLATALTFLTFTLAASQPEGKAGGAGQVQPTLEKLFPKQPLLGWAPVQVSFSHDGRYAAYVHYRDLWIVETATGNKYAALSTSTLDKFRSADKDTPAAYHGVAAYTWSPSGDELVGLVEGHIYRYQVSSKEITRLTTVRQSDWQQMWWTQKLTYLPDGSGYLFARGYLSALSFWKGTFAGAKIEPWWPKLPAGEQSLDFALSPDGQHMALRTLRGDPPSASSRKVEISTYVERFMKVKFMPRQLAEDPLPHSEVSVYVAPLTSAMAEAPAATRVFNHAFTGRRDLVSPVSWSPDGRKLAFARYEQTTGKVQILESELVEPRRSRAATGTTVEEARVVHSHVHNGSPSAPFQVKPWYLADSRRLVFISEQSGFMHLHKLDTLDGDCAALTSGSFEVYPIALSKDRKSVYVAATKEHPACRDLYRVSALDGTMTRLTKGPGVYGDPVRWPDVGITTVAISPDGETILASHAAFGQLPELFRIDAGSGQEKALTRSHGPEAGKWATARPEFFHFKNRHGDEIYGYAFKPEGWQKTDKRPALVYAYGGPLGIDKMVLDGRPSEDHLFAYYMARKHGYVTVVIDPRGSSGYGGAFERANFEKPGQAAVEDLEDGVKFLVENFGVDARRVGLHGWSFGGFVTQKCLYNSDTFAAGIAGAGPTEWENYNGFYTTGVIGKPGPDGKGLKRFTLLPEAKNLKGQLLLVHGMVDDNVLLQDTVRIYRALLQAGKATQVELFLDPTGNHGMRGDVQDLDKYRKYEQFLLRTLGRGLAGEETTPIRTRGETPRLVPLAACCLT
jgi:dipeptidyl aminopeptidase/acylaminoacyl peptidase